MEGHRPSFGQLLERRPCPAQTVQVDVVTGVRGEVEGTPALARIPRHLDLERPQAATEMPLDVQTGGAGPRGKTPAHLSNSVFPLEVILMSVRMIRRLGPMVAAALALLTTGATLAAAGTRLTSTQIQDYNAAAMDSSRAGRVVHELR